MDTTKVPNFKDSNDTVNLYKDTIIPSDPQKNLGKVETIGPEDSTRVHSPKKAMLLAAFIPGAGQIYNRKYWKAPIAWAGYGVLAYFINQNSREYQRFRRAYIYNVDGDSSTVSEYPNIDPSVLANERDIYRKWRDLSIILTVAWHALTIVDANVDAHLFDFDVSDVATIHWEPSFNVSYQQPKPFNAGLKLTMRF